MVRRIVLNALRAQKADKVIVATCDPEIEDHVRDMGVRVVMTSPDHARATERTEEAVSILESEGEAYDLVLMLQGDEPCIDGITLDNQIQTCLDNPNFSVTNLVAPIQSREEFANPNTIKCALSQSRSSIVFLSRSEIAAANFTDQRIIGKQVCSITFSREALKDFASLPESGLEIAESVDMLRFIESGSSVYFVPTTIRTHPVDVPSDIPIVERILANLNEPGL